MNTKHNTSLASDTIALFILRLVGTGVPLIAIPVMSRRLGPEAYGEVAIGIAVYSFMATASLYGFLISANRQVALANGDRVTIQRTLQNVFTYQVLLAVFVLLVFLLLRLFVEIPGQLQLIILAAIGSILIGTLFPSWAFQGLRMLKEGAIVEVASRLALVAVLVFFVDSPDDVVLAFLTQVFWVLPAGLYSVIRFSLLGYFTKARLVTMATFRFTLADGLAPFLTNVFTNIYTALNTLVLGAISGPASVANYTGGDKLILAARMPTDPLLQAVFPRLVNAIDDRNAEVATRLSRTILWGLLFLLTCAAIFCFIFGPAILRWYLGPGYELAGEIARVLALALPFVAITRWAAICLQAAGFARKSTVGVIVGAIAHITYVAPAAFWLGGIGVAAAIILTEAIIAVASLVQFWRVTPRFSIAGLFPKISNEHARENPRESV